MVKKLIKHLLNRWDYIILAILILTYIITLSTLSISRHDAFASRFDLSNMDQTLWYTLHGHFFELRNPDILMSRFSIHADLILALLAPLYLIWDNVRMLIASESIFLAIGALPIYLLSIKLLKNKIISLILATVYLLNPGMQWTDIYEFHGVSLAIPFLLFAFYFAFTNRIKWYAFFIFLALITKENVSLTIAAIGLVVLFVFKKRWIGLATIVISITWFFIMVSLVMPHFSLNGVHWALEGMGTKDTDPLLSIFMKQLNPSTFQQTFFGQNAIEYYITLLKPFAFLPLLGLPWLLLSVPQITINLLRGTTTIVFHYDSITMPGLVLATIFGFYYVSRLGNHFKKTKRFTKPLLYLLAAFLLAIALRVNYHYSPLPTTPSCSCYIYNVTQEDREFEKMLQSLPKDAFITSSLEIRPHVSHRYLSFALPSATESAQYIAIITQNRLISNYETKDYENKLIPILLASHEHKVVYRSKHFYLFEKLNYNPIQSYP